MTCLDAQGLITAFIYDELDYKALDEFLHHVNTCAECREELEVYFTLLTAMKQLDEDKNLSENFKQELASKLSAAEEKIIHKKVYHTRKKVILILCVILSCFGINLRYSYILEQKKADTSSFTLRFSFSSLSKENELREMLETYLTKEKALREIELKNSIFDKNEIIKFEDGTKQNEENYIN